MRYIPHLSNPFALLVALHHDPSIASIPSIPSSPSHFYEKRDSYIKYLTYI
jgi:hypothetical protein